jgi:hypothetical protein
MNLLDLRGCGCKPRAAHGKVTTRGARFHSRRPSRGAQPVPGAAGNGGRTEARQGAIRIFFGDTFPASAPRDPPFRLHPMRDPANRPLARDPARTPGLLAGPGFARSRIRFREVRLRCACGRPSAPGWDEDGGIGISRKRGWPPAALPSLCRCRRVHPRVEQSPPAGVP